MTGCNNYSGVDIVENKVSIFSSQITRSPDVEKIEELEALLAEAIKLLKRSSSKICKNIEKDIEEFLDDSKLMKFRNGVGQI